MELLPARYSVTESKMHIRHMKMKTDSRRVVDLPQTHVIYGTSIVKTVWWWCDQPGADETQAWLG